MMDHAEFERKGEKPYPKLGSDRDGTHDPLTHTLVGDTDGADGDDQVEQGGT